MLKKLKLERFKNFKDAELSLGPLTLLVGTNASGKSNIRDALRFLHGISRGYTIAEIIGEKWIEGGVLQWRGIRGGTQEVAYNGLSSFTLEVLFTIKDGKDIRDATYRIKVNVGKNATGPRVADESLAITGHSEFVFHCPPLSRGKHILIQLQDPRQGEKSKSRSLSVTSDRPILGQLSEHSEVSDTVREFVQKTVSAFSSMRFLRLEPDAMRIPSLPGQTVLGDRGENLSSVLQAICKNERRKQALTHWIKELTPMDAEDFQFPADPAGKVLVALVEENGRVVSAHSASDGTLRFLAMIAALLGPDPARFYFFEELENGIHPNRLYLLLQLIEQKVYSSDIQVIATTHSPELMQVINEKTLQYVSLSYRLKNKPNAGIRRILDIPDAQRLIHNQTFARLHTSGWFEDTLYLLDDSEVDA